MLTKLFTKKMIGPRICTSVPKSVNSFDNFFQCLLSSKCTPMFFVERERGFKQH